MWTLLEQIFIDYQSITEVFGKNVDTFGTKWYKTKTPKFLFLTSNFKKK
jgi:hypothetical protein